MERFEQLVKALRWCANDEICTEEVNCGYWNKEPFCTVSLMTDAAAAIEDLQAEVDALKHDIERYVGINAELTTENEALHERIEDEDGGAGWTGIKSANTSRRTKCGNGSLSCGEFG